VSTVSRWLEQHQGIRRPEAQRLVRVARTLQKLPDLAFPFATGEIRLGHLDAIARIVPSRLTGDELAAMWAALGECQGELIDAAANTPIRRFEHFCGRVRERLDVTGPDDRSAEPSRIWLHPLFDGRWSLTGDLSADDGAVLAAFLEQRTRRDLHNRCNQAADGVADTDTAGDTVASAEGADEPVVMADVRAQALLGLCRDGAGARAPGRVALNLHLDLEELRSPAGFPPRAWTGAGSDITEASLWGLLAGADIRPVFCQGGTPLSYGRRRRLAPDILKTILAYRDRECMVGLCDVPHTWLDAHHLTHWEHGGTTDSTDMRCGCGFHHRGHHQGRWKIVAEEATGEVETWRPDGSLIDGRPRWVTDRRPTDPEVVAIRERLDELEVRRRRRRRRAA
jgi:hypothetical protein